MEIWLQDHSTNTRTTLDVAPPDGQPINIGRDEGNQIVLASPFVARRHARIMRRGNQFEVEALCRAGTRVANQEILPGKPKRLDFGDEIQIGQFSLALVGREGKSGTDTDPDAAAHHNKLMNLEQDVHADLLERMNLRVTGNLNKTDNAFVEQILIHLEQVLKARLQRVDESVIRYAVKTHLKRLVLAEVVRQCQGKVQTDYRQADARLLDAEKERKVTQVVMSIVDLMPLLFEPTSVSDDLAVAEESYEDLFDAEYKELSPELRRYLVLRTVSKDIQDIMFGLGPLQDLLEMPSVSEIMVVGKDRIYIEKSGNIEPTTRTFFNEDVLLSVIERILTPVGRRVDTSTPLVDARLPDGSRVNVVISPLSLVGPCLTIRKFGWVPFTIDDLIDRGTISEQAATFLQGCIVGRQNIIISGGTGSGKTTLLNVLSAYCRPAERIVTIEESAELQLPQPHVVKLEGRPANVEGKGAYTIRELVRNALRMRPDRVIVGEVRGPEALDMLQAMNTGHDGSLSTLHANTPDDAAKRLETLVLMAVEMPIRAIREQITSAVDLFVQVARFADGSRRVTHISELVGMDPDTHQIRTEDIFTLKDAHQDRMRHTGYIPTFAETSIKQGHFGVEVFL